MEFTFTTTYDLKAMTAMARGLRKTVRKKHSRRSRILGWIVAGIGLLLTLPLGGNDFSISIKTIITWIAIAVILVVLIKEDTINGYIARKRALPQLKTSEAIFKADGYRSTTEVGASDFRYENIIALAETKEYFIFIFSKSHAQVYDKSRLTGGTIDSFRTFIQNVTGCSMQIIG